MKLSVIIPTYNEGKFLRSSLKNLLAHLPEDSEIVEVVDEVGDMAKETLASLRLLKRVATVHLGERMGVARSRNFGVAASQGDVLCFCDAHVWVKRGHLRILMEDVLNGEDAFYAPAFSHIRIHKRVGTGRRPLPINYGNGLVYAHKRGWFYLCVDRVNDEILKERTAANAAGITLSRRLFERIGGWVHTPGFWGSNDAAIAIKAFLLGIPIRSDPRVWMLHGIKSTISHQIPRGHETLNRFYVARTLFSDRTYETFWRPLLTERYPWTDEEDKQLYTRQAEMEHQDFRRKVKRTDEEFLERFVYPRIQQWEAKHGGS